MVAEEHNSITSHWLNRIGDLLSMAGLRQPGSAILSGRVTGRWMASHTRSNRREQRRRTRSPSNPSNINVAHTGAELEFGLAIARARICFREFCSFRPDQRFACYWDLRDTTLALSHSNYLARAPILSSGLVTKMTSHTGCTAQLP